MSILGDEKARSGYLPLLPGIKHLRFNCKEDLGLIDDGVAGVVVEPIQAEAGIIEPGDDLQIRIIGYFTVSCIYIYLPLGCILNTAGNQLNSFF